MNTTTLSKLRDLPIAHTDTGDFLYDSNGPQLEFLVNGKITKSRSGLFFIEIEDEKFTTHKNSNFDVGQEVVCVIKPKIANNKIVDFIISGLEKINL